MGSPREEVQLLLESHVAAMDNMGEFGKVPVLAEWVLVMAVDSADDPTAGNVMVLHGNNQFVHRSVGLLHAAIDMEMRRHD